MPEPTPTPPAQPTPAPGPPNPPDAPTASSSSKAKPAEPLKPLTGFRSALEHTGIPRGVLTWKPRLPSRNWSIFLTVSGTLFYLYYDDRRQCRIIKEETLKKVEHMGKEPLAGGSLAEVRKIKVYGARCPEDGDDDRALRYFRKYMKVCHCIVMLGAVIIRLTGVAIPRSRSYRLRVSTHSTYHSRFHHPEYSHYHPLQTASSSWT